MGARTHGGGVDSGLRRNDGLWGPGNDATRHWVAGIKQSDWDAGDYSGIIWTAADGSNTHTVSGLDSGAEYVFAVAAGRADQWSAWSPQARGTAQ